MDKQKKPLVINLIGGPGSGKSTTMAGVFHELKIHGVNCEMIPEYAKDRVYEEAFNTLQDQIYIFAKQSHKIWRLVNKVDVIVMDASLLTIPIYDKTHNSTLKKMVIEEFNRSENLVYFIDRGNVAYKEEGRTESFTEAQAIDKHYIDICKEYHIPFVSVTNTEAVERILSDLKELGYLKD